MKRKFELFMVTMVLSFAALAQDFHLSLYDSGPLFLNPALTGVVDAKLRVHAQYRNQWNAVAYKPFNTALLSADVPAGKWGYGIQLIEMRAGIGNYNVFQAMLSGAYNIPIDKNKYHQLSFGLQGGITQKSVEYKLYTYDNQYVTTNGGSFDTNLPNNENFARQSQILPQVNAGLIYYYAKQQSRINPFIGVSGFNLTQPKETFFDEVNKLPIRIYTHAGIRINLSELLYVLPKVLVMNQGSAFEQTYALDAGYYFKNEKFYILAGFTYRNRDASIVYAGFRKENYIFKIGYDFNTSSLRSASKTRGAFELSFTYMLIKNNPKEIKNCPRI